MGEARHGSILTTQAMIKNPDTVMVWDREACPAKECDYE